MMLLIGLFYKKMPKLGICNVFSYSFGFFVFWRKFLVIFFIDSVPISVLIFLLIFLLNYKENWCLEEALNKVNFTC